MKQSVYQIVTTFFNIGFSVDKANTKDVKETRYPKLKDKISAFFKGRRIETIKEPEFSQRFYSYQTVKALIAETNELVKRLGRERYVLGIHLSSDNVEKYKKLVKKNRKDIALLLANYDIIEAKLILYGKIAYAKKLVLEKELSLQKEEEFQKLITICQITVVDLTEKWKAFQSIKNKDLIFIEKWRSRIKSEFNQQ